MADELTATDIPWGMSVQPDLNAPIPVHSVKWLDADAQLSAMAIEDEESKSGRRTYLSLPALDEQIGGIRRGEVCGLMARPGIGKTLVLCHVAQGVAEFDWHVLFSLEMPAVQIVARLQQRLYRLGRHQREDQARAKVLDLARYRDAFRKLLIVETPGLAVWQIQQIAQEIQTRVLTDQPIGLITIDHLGLVGGDRALSTYDRVSVQAREIKELAKTCGCAVLVAIQVNRESGGDGSRELALGSARDSGVVEEAMDYLVGMRRLDRSTLLAPVERDRHRDVLWMKVIKNRHGDVSNREVAYRFSPVGLDLHEDLGLTMNDDQVARIAEARSARR